MALLTFEKLSIVSQVKAEEEAYQKSTPVSDPEFTFGTARSVHTFACIKHAINAQ
jgi:hypothetical protein